MSRTPMEQVEAIERACTALMQTDAPAVIATCREILERCYLLRWYEGEERDPFPVTSPADGANDDSGR